MTRATRTESDTMGTLEVPADSVRVVRSASSISFAARVFLDTRFVVYRRISLGASGSVDTRSPT